MKKATYYIIDDDIDDQQFLMEALTEQLPHVQLYTACSVKDGLNELEQNTFPLPDAIFLDLNLPGMSGKDCLVYLKKSELLKDVPVVIYSTSSDQNEKNILMQLGAFHFLTKAFSMKALRQDLSLTLQSLQSKEAVSE